MKKLLTLTLTVLMVLTAIFGLTACQKDPVSDVDYIKNKGTLVVGITLYKPMDWLDEDSGEWIGFDADMANKLGEKLDVTVQFVVIKWANKVAELKSKNIDCIWNGMTATAELDANIDFSCSYAENRQVAVVKTENLNTYNSVNAIKTASIAVEQGSAGDIEATNTVQGTNINRVKDQVGALTEVASGNSQVALIDLTMAQSVVGNGAYAGLSIVDINTVSFGQEEFAVGVRTGSNLAAEINALFKETYTDGTLATLATKYGGIALNTAKLGAL
ncbi:MAG: transporter substrate-binding domain-containing protein [Clostridia bacterium]|nr:transporter substrate-binding domain-containing protein [Clostridia bacterium]